MMHAIGRAATTTVHQEPDPRAPVISQLVLGETAVVEETQGRWRQVRFPGGDATGWAHAGSIVECGEADAVAWTSRAAWCNGALLQVGAARRWVPLRGRMALVDGEVELPGGEMGRVVWGAVAPPVRMQQDARRLPPDEWAHTRFAGTPYLWGGVTPGGVDCSGLVQTTWLARGVGLPRDAAAQATRGTVVSRDQMRAGDLLFFQEPGFAAVSHVAIAGPDATMVHASLAAGGVAVDSWLPGQPGAALMDCLVGVRRHPESDPAAPS